MSPTDRHGIFRALRQGFGQHGLLQLRSSGVHFVALVNVMNFKAGGLGALGDEQLAGSRPILKPAREQAHRRVRAYAAMDDLRALGLGHGRCRPGHGALQRFGSVTVLNGHIHQIVQQGRRQHHLPYRALDRLSAAGRRRWARTRTAESAAGSARGHAGLQQSHDQGRSSRVQRHDARLNSFNTRKL